MISHNDTHVECTDLTRASDQQQFSQLRHLAAGRTKQWALIIIIIIIIIRQLIRRRNMSMKSLQRHRTAYATQIKLIKMRVHTTTAKTNYIIIVKIFIECTNSSKLVSEALV